MIIRTLLVVLYFAAQLTYAGDAAGREWLIEDEPSAGKSRAVIDIAGHDVPVVAGGLYHRYRSNPPLEVIAQQAPDADLSWFKTLTKTEVDIGFTSWSPNFYYDNSRISVIYTADLDRLQALVPVAIRDRVQPLSIWPGRGLVVLTARAYHHCDNDRYNELAISIVTNKPGNANLGPLTLAGQALGKDFWGYVLKLPVNTELARVRGVVGYNLPKWLTRIDYTDTGSVLRFEIGYGESGTDLVLEGAKLDAVSTEDNVVRNSFINLDSKGERVFGYADSRQLRHGSSGDSADVSLQLGGGELSEFIRTLKLGKMIRYEYVPEFQSALYAPQPLAALLGEEGGH